MKTLAIFLSACLVAFYAIGDNSLKIELVGLNASSPWLNRAMYMMAHGSWIHLLVNIYSLLVLHFMCNVKWLQFVVAMAIAMLLPTRMLPMDGTYIVGISTYIYALTGVVIMSSSRWLYLITLNLFFILFASLLPNTNIAYLPHLFSFSTGIIVGLLTAKTHG